MIWLTPAALFALAAVAAPILIHILVQRRAERFPFPTLRFIAPTRLAAVRRHLLEDAALLAVRMTILAAAVAALAGPLLVTAARHRAWDQRIVRATVVETVPAAAPRAGDRSGRATAPYLEKTFDVPSLTDGIRRAVAWLDTAPPARRELVLVSPLAIGSLTTADLAQVPASAGIRFERTGSLPPARSVDGAAILTAAGVSRQRVTLSGPQTTVHETRIDEQASWPIDVRASPASQPAIDAAIAAVRAERIWLPPPDRRARLVVLDAARPSLPNVAQGPPPDLAQDSRLSVAQGPPPSVAPVSPPSVAQGFSPAIGDAAPIREAWMADAIARIAGDRELQDVASNVAAGISDPRYTAAPWHALASAADGRPVAVAAGSAAPLIVVSGASAEDLVTPLLMRSIVNSLAVPPNLQTAEVVPIPDQMLREWSRPAPPVTSPRVDTVDEDDRRWLWLTALLLLGVETWMRRSRMPAAREDSQEAARVA